MARLYMQGLRRVQTCLIMTPYSPIMPEYASMLLNILEHDFISLNVPEYA